MKNNLLVAILVISLIIVGFGIWFWTTFPSPEEINTASNPPEKIDVNILQSDVAQKVQKRDKNGDVPVTVKAGEVGREDPFSNY